jgi:hypothetical protein
MQNRHLFIILCLFFASCGSNQIDYLQNEADFLLQKIIFHKAQIEIKYELNYHKISPYKKLSDDITDTLGNFRGEIETLRDYNLISRLDQLGQYLHSMDLLQGDYMRDYIIPNRIDKWKTLDFGKANGSEIIKLIKMDLLKLESDIIEFLYNSIERDYYKFNKLVPVVSSSSNNVKQGDIYHAKIYLAGIDTFADPWIIITNLNEPDSILFNEKVDYMRTFNLLVEDGIGIYNMKTSTPGKKGFKGVIQILNPEGYIEKIPFRHEYIIE